MTSPSPDNEFICSFSNLTSTPSSFRWRTVERRSTVFRAKRLMDLVSTMSILHGYLIQCNDEPRNPLNDFESGSKWPQRVSSLKGICGHKKSASSEEETSDIDCFLFYQFQTDCRFSQHASRPDWWKPFQGFFQYDRSENTHSQYCCNHNHNDRRYQFPPVFLPTE